MTTASDILSTPYPSYHRPLEIAQKWTRSGNPQERSEAVTLLRGLSDKYPHALAIGQELVLALLESNQLPEAQQLLEKLQTRFKSLDEETLCRLGRLSKEFADRQAADLLAARQRTEQLVRDAQRQLAQDAEILKRELAASSDALAAQIADSILRRNAA